MKPEEMLNTRIQQEQQALQQSFSQEWSIVNNRFGPVTNNPRLERARKNALSRLHQEFIGKVSALGAKYRSGAQEIMESQVGIEESNVFKEYGEYHRQLGNIHEELKEFEVAEPVSVPKRSLKKRAAEIAGMVASPASAAYTLAASHKRSSEKAEIERESAAGKRVYKRRIEGYTEPGGFGDPIYRRVRATDEELERYEDLKSQRDELRSALERLRESEPMASRIRRAHLASPRSGSAGSFVDKAVGEQKPDTYPGVSPAPIGTPQAVQKSKTLRKLDLLTAAKIRDEAGGDLAKAEEIAKSRGYTW